MSSPVFNEVHRFLPLVHGLLPLIMESPKFGRRFVQRHQWHLVGRGSFVKFLLVAGRFLTQFLQPQVDGFDPGQVGILRNLRSDMSLELHAKKVATGYVLIRLLIMFYNIGYGPSTQKEKLKNLSSGFQVGSKLTFCRQRKMF